MAGPWTAFHFINDGDESVVWTIYGTLTSATIVGLLAAGQMLVRYMNIPYSFGVSRRTPTTLNEPIYPLGEISPTFLIEAEVMTEYTDISPEPGRLGVWIYSYNAYGDTFWDLIETNQMDEFFQGFISMANAFQVDFRDYLLGLPVDSEDNEYDLPQYELRDYFDI